MIVKPIKTRIFKEGENLADFIASRLKRIPERSVLVVTSKIVALAEGRTEAYRGEREKARIIRRESDWARKTKHVWLTVRDGMVMANAGVDESNARGKLILLPHDSFASARRLRAALRKRYQLKKLGVLITDSRTMPLRAGVTGVALGYAGFKGLRDYRKSRDLFGRKFKYARASTADGLAAAATLTMGEGNKCMPLALVTGASVEFCDRVSRNEIRIPPSDDMYKAAFPLS